jgi:hypothetical protein
MSHRLNGRGVFSLCLFLLVVLSGIKSSICSAQVSQSKRLQLISLAQASRESLGTRPYSSLEVAGQRVTEAAEKFAQQLKRQTTAERAEQWLRYVDFDPLLEAIAAKKSTAEITNAAKRLQSRLIGTHAGLEMPTLIKLRNENESLIASSRFVDAEASRRSVEQQIQSLIKKLEANELTDSAERASNLSFMIRFLDHSNQVPDLVTDFYQTFSRPNLVVTLDGSLIQDAIARPVDRFRPVRDCILGTRIIGNGHLQGNVVGRLAPSHGQIQVDLVLTGQFRSDSVGYNGPVRLPSIGQGAITVTRSLWIGQDGVSLSNVTSSASLNTTITSIQHPLGIVRRIASKQVAQKKPQADQIARERFRTQVVNDFEAQTSEAAQRLRSGTASGTSSTGQLPVIADAQKVFKRLNLSQPTLSIGSTSNSVLLQATQRTGKQLAASTPPPQLTTLDSAMRNSDATLQIHESLIDNLASTVLAGRTMTGQQIDSLIGSVKNTAISRTTPGSAIDPPPEKFEIEFSTLGPIIFELRDQKVRLGIRGVRFSQDGRELRSALEITATYEPVEMDGYKILRRVGVVQVDFPGTGRIGFQQVAQRKSIQKLFNDRFPETLLTQPVVFPVLATVPTLSGRVYRTSGIDVKDGWLTLTVR